MLQGMTRRILLLLVATMVIGIGIQVLGKTPSAQATDDPHNMRALLEQLKKQTAEQTTSVTFQLNTPLLKDGDTWVTVPVYDEKMDFERNWGDIGDDYICFDQRGGQGYVTRCIPFSNIAEVAFEPF